MADSDYYEFGVAHGRKYTLEHLWIQVLDEKKANSQIKIGISEFIRAEYGDIVRVILTKPEDDASTAHVLGSPVRASPEGVPP